MWSLFTVLPVPSRLTSLRAHMSIFAVASSLEIIAVALSGRHESALSLVVRTFQAARLSTCFLWLYGIRTLSTTTVLCGASVTSNAVALSESLLVITIRKHFVAKAAPPMPTMLGARALSLVRQFPIDQRQSKAKTAVRKKPVATKPEISSNWAIRLPVPEVPPSRRTQLPMPEKLPIWQTWLPVPYSWRGSLRMYYHLPRVTIQTSGGKELSYFSILERVFHFKFQPLVSIDQIIVVQF